ncbi:hypothetical protein IKL64_05880 [bacterium]|nr:hypothetical protein [bacterium]
MARQVRNIVKNDYITNVTRILIIAIFMLLSWLAVDLIKAIFDLALVYLSERIPEVEGILKTIVYLFFSHLIIYSNN